MHAKREVRHEHSSTSQPQASSAEDPMELWLASDEYATGSSMLWSRCSATAMLICTARVLEQQVEGRPAARGASQELIDLLQNDRERLLATVIMAVADRRPCDALANLHNFFPEAMQPKRSRRLPNQSQQATQQKPLHSIRNRTWRMQHEH
ncbi:hypothetical protein [Pseudomonas aeruginosa]|uniref:hypothetical protein n=1 Tax=Pseudomonas aeruginosa TaxID=287 RepID=UPI0018D4F433|nr:hypothetical protein [Pseudomonas aeruginosa]